MICKRRILQYETGYYKRKEEEYMLGTGLIHVYYGDGKGKTTAAVGQAVRAAGAGLRVLFFQFMKDNTSNEREIL